MLLFHFLFVHMLQFIIKEENDCEMRKEYNENYIIIPGLQIWYILEPVIDWNLFLKK